MSIDFSRVDISLKQFQKIASGKYNAGEVTLEGETKLGRTNHHIHFRSYNDTVLSHETVLASKLGVPPACLAQGLDLNKFSVKVSDLGDQIRRGGRRTRPLRHRPPGRRLRRPRRGRKDQSPRRHVPPHPGIRHRRLHRPALSLDPNGTTTTFSYGGGTQTRTFHLDRGAQGGITIRFENTVRPTHLLVDLDAHPLGAGSELKGGYTLTFSAQQLDTLAHKDFARCDNDNAENTMRAIPPVPQKLIAAVDRLPADFRLDLYPDTTFTATLR